MFSVLAFVVKRLLNNGVLVLSTAFGLLVTVTLVTAVPLYSEGLSAHLLKLELARPDTKITPQRASVLPATVSRSPSNAATCSSRTASAATGEPAGCPERPQI